MKFFSFYLTNTIGDPRGDMVEYRNQQAVLIKDPESDSAFFGTLRLIEPGSTEKELVGIDYDGNPVQLRGPDLNYLYIYRLKGIDVSRNQHNTI